MKFADELRALDLPPTQAADAAWEAARNARRRGIATAVGIASAVAVLLLIVAVLPGDSDERTDNPPPIVGTTECPSSHSKSKPVKPDYPDSGVLPRGANAVRMCAANGTWWDAPPEVLTADVDSLIDEINEQPIQPRGEPQFCHSHLIDIYTLMFTYPDGRTYTAIGNSISCANVLQTGETLRGGADAIRQSFLTRLLQQRRESSPPPDPPQATCPDIHEAGPISIVPLTKEAELVDAVICSYRWTLNNGGGWNNHLTHTAPVGPALLRELNQAIDTSLRPIDEEGLEMDNHFLAIYAKTAWGDDVTFDLLNGQLVMGSPNRLDDPGHPYAITPEGSITDALRWQP